MATPLDELKEKLADITYLRQAGGLLGWDQQTYMPAGAAESRSMQESALHKLTHEMFTSDDMGRMIDSAEKAVEGQDAESLDYQIVRMTRYDYERSRKLPAAFVAEETQTTSMAQMVWAEARKKNDFATFAPWLSKNLDLACRKVEFYGYEDQPYDALLGDYEPKFKTSDVQELFDQVRPVVVDLVKQVQAKGNPVSTEILTRSYPEPAQESFGKETVAAFGYDFNRGRLDRTTHPFASSFSKDDCRITTRYDEHFVQMALMGTMHEAGHAMYEQNTGDDLRGTPLGDGCSNSVHESQSRLWENLVGRGKPFWTYAFPKFQAAFPGALADADFDTVYKAFNKIEPSLIRVEADEVTYNLHIILRFELEQDLLNGKLKVEDAPEAWNAKMQEYLGVTPPTNSEGVMQDIHWSMGGMGYFPTYSLGNFLSAQLFAKVREDVPSLDDEIRQGDFKSLFSWLDSHIWQYGRRYFPQELIEKATGSKLQTGPYIAYLKSKFGEVYGLSQQ